MRNSLLLFIACLAFHVLGTWTLPLIDRDEPRFAEASREMRQRHDYIVPYFNGQYRFDKPPLTYWAQVASYRVFGENDFAARFPSAVAAALVSVVIFAWGSRMTYGGPAGGAPALQRLNDHRVGLWAAIIFALCLQTFIHAKAAVADMWLVLFMTTAFWAGWELMRQTPNETSASTLQRFNDSTILLPCWFMFFVSLAFAFLTKGPIGWIPLIAVVANTWLWHRPLADDPSRTGIPSAGSRSHVSAVARSVAFLGGILLMLGIISLWAVPALIRTHGEFFRIGIGRHVIGRSIGAMEGHGASSFLVYGLLLPYYFVFLFVSFFPWSVRLPWLMGRIRKERDSLDRYLLSGIISIFVIFTLVATKLPHYTLPAFPLIALLLARRWIGSDAAKSESAANDRRHSLFTRIAITTACAWVVIALVLPPFAARFFFPAYALFQKTRNFVRPDAQFGAVDYVEPSLVWYFRSRTTGYLRPLRRNNLAEFMAEPGNRFVLVPTSMAPTAVTNSPNRLKMFSTQGFNIAKGQKVDLTLVLKPE